MPRCYGQSYIAPACRGLLLDFTGAVPVTRAAHSEPSGSPVAIPWSSPVEGPCGSPGRGWGV